MAKEFQTCWKYFPRSKCEALSFEVHVAFSHNRYPSQVMVISPE